ncbi:MULTISPECIES: lytic transglycosylase domain-containing protein [unclassified Saccharopolyspora]|uniref:lytic transglycosylase domain-containing protein n=1 Tax=unclassified Saccharopolyspora TaxID=2646250 RepID=UPI001CD48C15|nr:MULTISPECIES: lytic transglycosylase domain-containing protein [unclassified Saccharopolyspora]MCA1185813.1 lytic murein transglycosylase [Saccharopolyspora sp. 6T]MCA1191725.1 lytic murein transglycosylase [Saccharopolyspora sp. 6V]MCA1227407.1 lytic murein transglycosylase [Saccharopolyspora sp. 6M]MCA1280929.1 lytic murein transglycosylase [Saccharopolyspora sp. 7B]
MAVRNTRPTARRRNRRRWRAATALTPTLLLVAASSTLLSLPPPTVRDGRAESAPDSGLYGASGHLPQTREPSTELLDLAGRPQRLPGPPDDQPSGRLDIPEPMMAAYVGAADRLVGTHPGCGVHWSVLASIGRIESAHARGGEVDVDGNALSAILGPRLSGGPGVAAIPDTDGGSLDGDPVWDRAVGAMQFIPGTWNEYALDGNDDGELSPHNVHDAAATAGAYLCSAGGDLRERRALAEAVFRYNHSDDYVRTVLTWADAYADGAFPQPVEPLPEPDGRDVLAGSRLPAARPEQVIAAPPEPGSGASALTPPSPGAPPAPDEAARPTWPGASTADPGADAPPEPGRPDEPAPEDGATSPAPAPAESSDPEDPSAPPTSGSVPPADQPPSDRPPSDAPPSDAPPSAGPTPTEPGAPASEEPSDPGPTSGAQPSSEEPSRPSATGEPSNPDEVPSSTAPPSADPGRPTAGPRPPGSATSEPTSRPSTDPTEPSTPVSSTFPEAAGVLDPCEVGALDEGRFVLRGGETAAPRLEAGTSDPGEAKPGEVVLVRPASTGPLQACEVPADFKPRP